MFIFQCHLFIYPAPASCQTPRLHWEPSLLYVDLSLRPLDVTALTGVPIDRGLNTHPIIQFCTNCHRAVQLRAWELHVVHEGLICDPRFPPRCCSLIALAAAAVRSSGLPVPPPAPPSYCPPQGAWYGAVCSAGVARSLWLCNSCSAMHAVGREGLWPGS